MLSQPSQIVSPDSLGGHLKIVSLLLENGANVTGVNSVGRTAAQMAAFVGQHAAVSIINNFVARDEVEYYSKRQGLEKEPKITPVLVDPILSLARQINIHPVKIAMIITESKVLYENLSKVAKVLELMCDREMKKEDPNEQLALKYHLLSFVTKQIKKFDEGIKSKDDDIQKRFEPLLKSWMKGRDEDGFPVTLEKLLRQSIREFGYRDCTIFLQLVKTLSSVEIGSEPSAVSILVQAMTGKKGSAMDDEVNVCSTCGEPNPPKKCSQCKTVPYCDVRCQKLHWFTHKNFCIKLKHNHELSEKLAKSAQITASDDNE